MKYNNGAHRTLCPVGNWTGVYTSVEILIALELGYTFRYIKGVYFETDYIFKDYRILKGIIIDRGLIFISRF